MASWWRPWTGRCITGAWLDGHFNMRAGVQRRIDGFHLFTVTHGDLGSKRDKGPLAARLAGQMAGRIKVVQMGRENLDQRMLQRGVSGAQTPGSGVSLRRTTNLSRNRAQMTSPLTRSLTVR